MSVKIDCPNCKAKIEIQEMHSPEEARRMEEAAELLAACKYVVQYHREKDSGGGELFGLDFVTTCISAIARAEGK